MVIGSELLGAEHAAELQQGIRSTQQINPNHDSLWSMPKIVAFKERRQLVSRCPVA